MAERVNKLSWSKSRAASLSECPRQYFFSYYGAWGGWSPLADERTRRIYLLKKLSSRPVWAGEVVHDAVEHILLKVRATGAPPALEKVLAEARERMREDFRYLRAGRYRQQPGAPALYEHDYQRPVTADEWRATAEHVDECLRQLYDSEVFDNLRELALQDWLEIEELTGFEVDGTRVHVKLDAAYRVNGSTVVLDWKTGKSKSQDHRFQFGCYSLYAVRQWGLDPEAVQGLEVNLARGKLKEHRFDRAALDEIEATIRASIEQMRELLRDADANLAIEEDFPKKESPWTCRRCNFLKVCDSAVRA